VSAGRSHAPRLPEGIYRQLADAYRRMAREARYRPAAPSDGLGNIAMPPEELLLDAEAEDYARRWWRDEEDGAFTVGCCNHSTRPATVFAIEAARCLCGGADATALRLLRMAAGDVRRDRRAGS
jgi:hypothetical protein